jgi:hypothetical protein
MRKVWNWLIESNRWKHVLGGLLIGLGADDWYCANYAGAGVALALELKDKMWGGRFDWIDAGLTYASSIVGQLIRKGVILCFQ